ncbi:MAG: carbohydrate-binding domain-containing protein [Muribaculaceae bacterium]|nr:carbohydrate-binding domain-containing protein [Muribaculaceae bacterium]
MKKHLIIAALAVSVALTGNAQTINFSKGGVTYSFPAETAGEMTFENECITVTERRFNLNEWSNFYVDNASVSKNTVAIQYSGNIATVNVSGDIAKYIEADVTGAHVTITQSDEVSESTCGEITYILKGEAADGSLTLNGSYKSTLELQGLRLVNKSGAAIDIQNGKRIAVSAKNGTVNSLTDGDGSQKGAIVCKGHLELKGKGQLTVSGNKSHAIYAKEYVEIKNLTLNITGAVKDGINCGQYFMMESGTLTITGTGDDGIQTAFKDDTDREAEDTGTLTVKGGTIDVSITADAAKCLKADADVIISGGTIKLHTGANGIWDSAKNKTKASACIGADGNVEVSGGTIDLTASGSGGKGISCDGVFRSDGGKITIATTGGMLVYSNGSLNHNYTASADRINSDYKSSSKGIKADSGVIINDGEIHITTATNNAEGIESKKELDINGGTIFVKAYDDGINSSGDFRVSGGDLTVISIVGDGLDSNGNLTISGGYVRTMGSGGMEMGLDAATESGCAVYITGGTLMAFGGSNTYPTKSGSTQAFVYTTGSIKADTEVSVKSGSEILATFTVPTEYSSSTSRAGTLYGPGNGPGGGGWGPGGNSGSGSLMISCPSLTSGKSYTIVNDATTTNTTATLTKSGL